MMARTIHDDRFTYEKRNGAQETPPTNGTKNTEPPYIVIGRRSHERQADDIIRGRCRSCAQKHRALSAVGRRMYVLYLDTWYHSRAATHFLDYVGKLS